MEILFKILIIVGLFVILYLYVRYCKRRMELAKIRENEEKEFMKIVQGIHEQLLVLNGLEGQLLEIERLLETVQEFEDGNVDSGVCETK